MGSEVTLNETKYTKNNALSWIRENNAYIIFVGMIVVCSCLTTNFTTWLNISNLLRQNTIIGIMAIGMLLVIMTGDIDLSVGSLAGVTNVLISVLIVGDFYGSGVGHNMSVQLALFLSLLFGTGLGCANGFFIVYRRLPSFIVTLAMMTIGRGLAYIWSKGRPINVKDPLIYNINNGEFLGLPQLVWFLIIVFAVFFVILRYTSYGRIIKAIGSNEEAVRLAGLRVKSYRFSVFAIVGFLCGLAGFLGCIRTGVGSPLFAEGFELDAIAMVVIGGASLRGGKGDATKTLVGIFIIGMISNIMNLTNVSAYLQQIIKGFIILAAIYLQSGGGKEKA